MLEKFRHMIQRARYAGEGQLSGYGISLCCDTCAFYDRGCRKNAPRPVPYTDKEGEPVRGYAAPQSNNSLEGEGYEGDWCAEWVLFNWTRVDVPYLRREYPGLMFLNWDIAGDYQEQEEQSVGRATTYVFDQRDFLECCASDEEVH